MDSKYKNKYLKYKNKYLELKNKKLVGGTLEELDSLSPDEKVIILVGETHQLIENRLEYDKIIKKQKTIYDSLVQKYGKEHTYFYTEAPEEIRTRALSDTGISSSIVVQDIIRKNPDKVIFSSVTNCNRDEEGYCDNKYALDIAKIYKKPDAKCVIAVVGLLHVEKIKEWLQRFLKVEVKIIIINTVSQSNIDNLMSEIRKHRPDLLELLVKEPPYDIELPTGIGSSGMGASSIRSSGMGASSIRSSGMGASFIPSSSMVSASMRTSSMPLSNKTFTPIVIIKPNGDKVYRCPICGSTSGTRAPKNPRDISLFSHNQNPICPNSGAIPVEE